MTATAFQTNSDRLVSRARPRTSILRWLTPFAALSAAAATGGCVIRVGGSTPFEARGSEALSASAPVTRLVVHNRVGDVIVTADPAASGVTAEAVKIGKGRTDELADRALSEISVWLQPRAGAADVLEAVSDHPDQKRGRAYAVDWRITAPPGLAIEVRADVGDVHVEGFDGPADLRTDVGDIRALQIARGVSVRTDVGDVTVKAAGPIDVRTDVGSADVAVLPGEPGSITITTDVGSAELRLPADFEGTITASADVGSITSTLAGPQTRARKIPPRDHLQTTIGSGSGRTATITTEVGDVRIRQAATSEQSSSATSRSQAPSM